MTRSRILFVDDEVAVLQGLRDYLRKDRHRWEVVFIASGQLALEELAKAPFDLVITDMRMPGMDGADLLAKVKELYPAAARMVLSGQADREAVLRAMPLAQQFLAKPCEAPVVQAIIERTFGLRDLLANERIRGIIGSLESLPSVPKTYLELTAAAAQKDSTIGELADIVERDPATSAKVLQLVNSAYFGGQQRAASIRGAVSYLGVDLVKGLALASSTFSTAEHLSVEGFSLEELRSTSLLVAQVARRIVDKPKLRDEAFTTGLIHDVGKIVMAVGMPAEYSRVAAEAARSGLPVHLVEQEIFGVSHAEVGAYLLGLWGLPFSIVEAVAYHHRPAAVPEGDCELLAAVHAADALVDARGPALDKVFLANKGFDSRLPQWQAIAAVEAARGAAA
jgi:HD-like signal output (HDOD) protein